nr:Uncharacterised protein [Providencia rettgeri]
MKKGKYQLQFIDYDDPEKKKAIGLKWMTRQLKSLIIIMKSK